MFNDEDKFNFILNIIFQEEIRSYRRSEERSKHIENLEYVKNIILKVRK